MWKNLRKRPMVRPLLIWITGILLQTSYDIGVYSFLLLLLPIAGLLFAVCCLKKQTELAVFRGRAMWGVHSMLLLLFLSIQFTALNQERKPFTLLPERISILAESVRDEALCKIETLEVADDRKAILATIALGYRQALPKEVRQRFALTGTAHILAVSGMHVAIVYGFLSFFFSLLPYKYKLSYLIYLLSLCLIWGYVLLTGYAPSAVRAGCMITLFLTGRTLVKRTDGYNTLAVTAFCMLVVQPFYLFDIGFRLSFIAVFFILYLEPLFRLPLQTKNPLFSVPISWLTVACAAQVGVTLLSVYYFGYTTLLFFFTAIPVSLLVTFLLPLSLVWILLPEWFPLYNLLQQGIEWVIQALYEIADRFSRIDVANLPVTLSRGKVIVGYIFLVIMTEYFRNRNRFRLQKSSTFDN